jgi:hypothetical protein
MRIGRIQECREMWGDLMLTEELADDETIKPLNGAPIEKGGGESAVVMVTKSSAALWPIIGR